MNGVYNLCIANLFVINYSVKSRLSTSTAINDQSVDEMEELPFNGYNLTKRLFKLILKVIKFVAAMKLVYVY